MGDLLLLLFLETESECRGSARAFLWQTAEHCLQNV